MKRSDSGSTDSSVASISDEMISIIEKVVQIKSVALSDGLNTSQRRTFAIKRGDVNRAVLGNELIYEIANDIDPFLVRVQKEHRGEVFTSAANMIADACVKESGVWKVKDADLSSIAKTIADSGEIIDIWDKRENSPEAIDRSPDNLLKDEISKSDNSSKDRKQLEDILELRKQSGQQVDGLRSNPNARSEAILNYVMRRIALDLGKGVEQEMKDRIKNSLIMPLGDAIERKGVDRLRLVDDMINVLRPVALHDHNSLSIFRSVAWREGRINQGLNDIVSALDEGKDLNRLRRGGSELNISR